MLLRSFEKGNDSKTDAYIEKCREKCKEIVTVDVLYYYKLEYRDAFGIKHERYFDVTPIESKELGFNEGRSLFEKNSKLEELDYLEDKYPTFNVTK